LENAALVNPKFQSSIHLLNYFGINPTGILAFFLLSTLIIITFIDLEHMIIPDRINKPGMIFGLLIGLINQFYLIFETPFSPNLTESFIGLICGYGLLYLIAWTYFKISGVSGLGGGDIKLMGFMGALLGPYSVMPILVTASFMGSIIGISLLAFKKSNFRTEIPFGPWLALGIAFYIFGFDAMSFIRIAMQEVLLPSYTNG
jgi:leader peptidase (prepilin peptidase)/N-methyltransferase